MKLSMTAVRGPSLPFALICSIALTYPVEAKERRPELLAKLVECGTIAESAARLACYDRQVKELDVAEKDQKLVIADQEQIRRTRRSLFGLTLPSLAVFGGGDDEKDNDVLESTISQAFQNRNGRWTIILEDGARWVQDDDRRLGNDAKAGQPIKIRRAAMGSFLANINGQIALRMRRATP